MNVADALRGYDPPLITGLGMPRFRLDHWLRRAVRYEHAGHNMKVFSTHYHYLRYYYVETINTTVTQQMLAPLLQRMACRRVQLYDRRSGLDVRQ